MRTFPVPFGERHDGGIYVPRDRLLGGGQAVAYLTEAHIANHHKVDVAPGTIFLPGKRAVDETEIDAAGQRPQCSSKKSMDAGGFRDEGIEIEIQGMMNFSLVKYLAPANRAANQASGK